MASPRRPGPSVRLAVTFMVIGGAIGLVAAVKALPPFFEGLTGPVRATPLEARLRLSTATYGIYERTGTSRGGGGFTVTKNDAPRIARGSVTVTSPLGQPVPIGDFGNTSETLTRNEAIFTGAATFRADAPGIYTVRIAGERPGQVIIARSLGSTFSRVAGWIGVGVLGGMFVVAGGLLLAVGTIRRDRAEAAAWTSAP